MWAFDIKGVHCFTPPPPTPQCMACTLMKMLMVNDCL